LKYLGLFIVLLANSAVSGEPDRSGCVQPVGFFIAVGYARLQTPDHAYIFGSTNLPPSSALMVKCYDFIGQGSHLVSQDATITVPPNGLFHFSVAPKQPYELKGNMICTVAFHAWKQPAAVLKKTGQRGEKLGDARINSQIGIYSGGQYLEAETVLH
jgi:hypothetical protein